MLSGFFGLIAIETSAGLIAEGSVMRTTCCAEASVNGKQKISSSRASLVHDFILVFFQRTWSSIAERGPFSRQSTKSTMAMHLRLDFIAIRQMYGFVIM